MKAHLALGISALTCSLSAQAAIYFFHGQQTQVMNTESFIETTMTPLTPAIGGYLDMERSYFLGGLFGVDAYTVHTDVQGGTLVADTHHFNAAYQISGGTLHYDPQTFTSTVTGATAIYMGNRPSCTGHFLICTFQGDVNLENVEIILNFFDATSAAFTGTIIGTDINPTTGAGDLVYTWTITNMLDVEVPLPAAAWLFGSGLLGLMGVARKRR